MHIKNQVVLVTGGARGLGLAITHALINEGAFDASFQHFGQHINAVINNALIQFEFNGEARPKVHELRWETMQQQFEGAVKAALNTTQAALEGMKQSQFGRIVNIGTNLVQNPVVPYHDYTTAKAALLAFTRTSAHELGQYGININMLSGGLLQTTDASKSTPNEVFDYIASATPLRRVVTPEEFASAILMFLSPYSRAVTGQNLIVDGGLVKG